MRDHQPLQPFLDGVDRKALSRLRDRLQGLAELRRLRWASLASERQRQFLEILPLLLDVNHALLPGYVGADCPQRVQDYTPSATALQLLQGQARSFRWRPGRGEAAIKALYLMGSSGSIAQTTQSDLDIWVCVDDHIGSEAAARLQGKLERISAYARQQGIEAHFFQMRAQAFRQGERLSLSHEDCGATQHVLLLDEFYRSALWLAGAWPLWWFIPAEEEASYAHHAQRLLHGRYLRAEQVIDLGDVARVPDEEFLGAGMWQLFKGMGQPIKAVLKIILAEVYAAEQPQLALLSLELKQRLYRSALDDELDPYVLLYEKVAAYLQARDEYDRLHLVRQCFYLKANVHLSREPADLSWRHQLLQRMVQSWGWAQADLALLDSREHWRFRPLLGLHERLVQEMQKAYHLLERQFAATGRAPSAALGHDLELLRRRMAATYSPRPDKISWRQPYMAGDFLEESLYLREVSAGLWQLTEHADMPPLYTSRSALEALVWALGNGLADARTHWQLASSRVRRAEFELLAYRLAGLTVGLQEGADDEQMAQPPVLRRLVLIINHVQQASDPLSRRGLTRIADEGDVLAYGGLKRDLLRTIDVVSVNSWCELELSTFRGEQALIRCLLHLLPHLPLDFDLQVIQAAPGVTPGSMPSRVASVLRHIVVFMHSSRQGMYLLRTGQQFHLLIFRERQLEWQVMEDIDELGLHLQRADRRGLPFNADIRSLRDEPLGWIMARRDGYGHWYESRQAGQERVWVDDGRALFMARGKASVRQVREILRQQASGLRAEAIHSSAVTGPGHLLPAGLIVALYEACADTSGGA